MSKPELEKQEQAVIPPMDPRLLAAMYGMRQEDDEIDLLEYWRAIWKNRVLLVAFGLVVGVLAAIYSLTLPNTYKAEVLLAPVSDDAAKGSSLSQFGGLASLAGIAIGGGGDVEENLAVLKSREFIWRFIKDEKLMPVLFKDAWDAEKGSWKDAAKQPTQWAAFRAFSGHIRVFPAKDGDLLTLAVVGQDGEQAARWANALVARLNDYLRQRAVSESEANLTYLNRELARTQVEDMRQSLFQLISQEQNKAMLANTRNQYAFRVLDAAVPPDRRFKPQRSTIVVLSVLVAGFFAVIGVIVREGMKRRRDEEAQG